MPQPESAYLERCTTLYQTAQSWVTKETEGRMDHLNPIDAVTALIWEILDVCMNIFSWAALHHGAQRLCVSTLGLENTTLLGWVDTSCVFFNFYVAYGVACHLVACIIPKPPWSACWWQWQHCKERALQLQCAECQLLPGSSPQGHHVSVSVGKATDISYISYSLLLDFEKSRNTGRTQPLKKTCLHSKCDRMPWNARECHGNLATKWQLKKSNLSRQLLSTTEWGLLWLVAEAENIREEATETCESGAVPSKTKNATHGGNGANKTKNKTRI